MLSTDDGRFTVVVVTTGSSLSPSWSLPLVNPLWRDACCVFDGCVVVWLYAFVRKDGMGVDNDVVDDGSADGCEDL